MSGKLTLLYLAGGGRSGSTLISRILETDPEIVSMGEISLLWRNLYHHTMQIDDLPCACGLTLGDCPFWRDVLGSCGWTREDIGKLAALQNTVLSPRSYALWPAWLWLAICSSLGLMSRRDRDRFERLAEMQATLYHAVAKVSGAKIIVDASGIAPGIILARRIRDVRLVVKHLVRNPQGVVASWAAPKFHQGLQQSMASRPPSQAVLSWPLDNLLVEMVGGGGRRRRLRYEDFADDPEGVIRDTIVADLPVSGAGIGLAFESPGTVRMRPSHALLGNPDNFGGRIREIRRDDRYLEFSRFWRTVAVVLSLPLYLLYGYGRPAGRRGGGMHAETDSADRG